LLREVHAEISKGSKIPFFKLLGMKLEAKKAKELKAKLALEKNLRESQKRLNDTISSH